MLRKIAAGWSRLKPWMKRALAAILILMVLSRGLALARTIQRNRLADQNEGKRWAADGSAAQISCFFSEDAGLTQDSIPELEYNLLHGLEAASITGASLGLPEAVPLLEDCWSASGKIEISHNGVTVSCGAVGTGSGSSTRTIPRRRCGRGSTWNAWSACIARIPSSVALLTST
jgi:hypothetical protein